MERFIVRYMREDSSDYFTDQQLRAKQVIGVVCCVCVVCVWYRVKRRQPEKGTNRTQLKHNRTAAASSVESS
jgi:hypothetical protein